MEWRKIITATSMMLLGTVVLQAQEKAVNDSTKVVSPASIPLQKTSPDYLKVTPIQNNYYNQLGAACKLELNFEKSTKVPLRVRLGSLQQTDYMEQKPNAVKPGK